VTQKPVPRCPTVLSGSSCMIEQTWALPNGQKIHFAQTQLPASFSLMEEIPKENVRRLYTLKAFCSIVLVLRCPVRRNKLNYHLASVRIKRLACRQDSKKGTHSGLGRAASTSTSFVEIDQRCEWVFCAVSGSSSTRSFHQPINCCHTVSGRTASLIASVKIEIRKRKIARLKK
jgi:hypothetical protein